MIIVAIHQPNFFPWLGFFSKIYKADKFIFLDDVQYQKTGGSWSNRVKLMVSGEPRWVTAPIERNYHGTRSIKQIAFIDDSPWRDKLIKTIDANYRRHPFYSEVMGVIDPLISNPVSNMAEYNVNAVLNLCEVIGIDIKKIQISSDIPHTGVSNELLCSLTRTVDGDTYMCGGGADGYQDESVFNQHGIILQRQDFIHPQYEQYGKFSFVPGLSIIDAAMNVGFHGVRSLIKNG